VTLACAGCARGSRPRIGGMDGAMPKRWSTKNLTILREPTADAEGIGVFEFTDDYSIFHYGKMPDRIPGKGEALCRMAVANFEMLGARGIETHYLDFMPPNRIQFRLLRVLDPGRGELYSDARNCLIPLQVIFRNSLPPGSSVFRRLASDEISLASLGLSRPPRPGDVLASPVVEFTTKLEEIDRFVDQSEARQIARLTEAQMARIRQLTIAIDGMLTEHATAVGLDHSDGKLEFGIAGNGTIILVDVAGTADENRFLLGDFHVGKQIMRDYYAKTDLGGQVRHWAANKLPRENWPQMENLPAALLPALAAMYRALTERWTRTAIWGGASLEEAVAALRALQGAR
jgi:phosphoribosylaminoimidazole-succinocarboxamide synthase